mmetsp:Transcript_6387/g.19204  ORF Transcript_6387/g.19204 Transcript_6387/m.19204 type:complete len:112 (-) Transcript_6387:167-502(-)
MESMLCYVCNTKIRVLVEFCLVVPRKFKRIFDWIKFTNHQFNESRFSCSICTNNCYTTSQRTLYIHISELWFFSSLVLERQTSVTEDSFSGGLDTFKRSWWWEFEFLFLSG